MRTVTAIAAIALLSLLPAAGSAQTSPVGTRAQGMGGAFVGVADDASAVYWNPAGLASGAFFSLVLDGSGSEAVPDREGTAGARSGWLLALTTPALGLSYYRLESRVASLPEESSPAFRLDSLVTHHVGATFVQSLRDGLAVGATVKLVRGHAGAADVGAASAAAVLDDWDIAGRKSHRFDLDLGIMAAGALARAGLVVRNATEPSFPTATREMPLEREVRAGASILLLHDWRLASDLDLTSRDGPSGPVREFALGAEGQLNRRFSSRAGLRVNTAGGGDRTPSLSIGASYAVYGAVLLDAQVTVGPDDAFRGWGLAGRLAY